MINIAIMGMGVVGGGLCEAVSKNKDVISSVFGEELYIKYVLDKRTFPGHELENRVVNDINIILNDPTIAVVAETMGGDKPAYDFSLACLKAGKSVVTSNKLVVEKHASELEEEALKNGVCYLYEASVGGGIPVIHPLMHCLSGNRITKIAGILNGTTNYILDRMEKDGCSFEDALSDAQRLGYAEANPDADIEGLDAARKICILASVCFGSWYRLNDCAEITGISEVTLKHIEEAKKMGYKIKLLGVAENSDDGKNALLFVKPCLVPEDDLLYAVNGVFNCITVTGNLVGEVAFYGHGAGGLATSSAVLSDIIEAVKIKTPPCEKSKPCMIIKNIDAKSCIDILGIKYPVI
ncbi:MAG: homoserine dehydrogenase [Eubacteriales bacterium]|nr:homoserine dehydrogenase [Eubacteriales bacterium]